VSLPDTFTGLRVLDLATNIAGPLAAMILGDLGADVVKIERAPYGDDTRSLPPQWDGEATVFLALNRNKRSVLLDLKDREAREALLALARDADVVIESFGPGVPERLGLTFEDFRAANPRVVLCSISAFGDGPIGSRRPGYDALVQAFSGLMSFTGHPDTPPVRIAPSALDLSTGQWATIAILAALARRGETSEAQHVRAALLDSAVMLMCHQLLGFLATGEQPLKLGSSTPSAAPYRVYETADGALMVATANEIQFTRLCEALELPELATDPRFATMADRIAAREELDALLARRFVQEPSEVWIERLRPARVGVAPVNDVQAALADPLTQERGLLVEGEDGRALLRLPFDIAGECVRAAPPKLGEHTEEVLREAGLGDEAIARIVQPAAGEQARGAADGDRAGR
jgi:crotonobetainyl-CoA:carnitine CoA-transferase CaiB-like acyl-CoA transferase